MSKKGSNLLLYADYHPEKSLKNTGFKDKETAIKTIELIKKRSLKYQYDVINTMYNRAKFHPHRTENMEEAMKIFEKWLSKYKKTKEKQDKEYKFLPLEMIKKFEELADEYGVSEIARGIKKGTKTDEGFLKVYKEVEGKAHKLQYIPIKKGKPEGNDYWSYRINFINSRVGQIKSANNGKLELFYKDGKYKGLPTKQHIILIMHAYTPDINKLKESIKTLNLFFE